MQTYLQALKFSQATFAISLPTFESHYAPVDPLYLHATLFEQKGLYLESLTIPPQYVGYRGIDDLSVVL